MEYEEEEINSSGSVPEFGAIFMCNIEMQRECFKRKIMALPSSQTNFVKQVKKGMILFLFEFEKRQLFGVYQATSDGGMNIASSPFVSSGKLFPAQVHFTPIWLCSPLFENEFREAIRDNYFTQKKFQFGLSEDQVRRLLQLFSARKLRDKVPVPPRQCCRIFTRLAGKDRILTDQGRVAMAERLGMRNSEDGFSPIGRRQSLETSPHLAIETDDIMNFIDDRAENLKYINGIGGNLFTVQVGTGLHDTHDPLLHYRNETLEDLLDNDRIPASRSRFQMPKNIENDHDIYASHSPAIPSMYNDGPLARRSDFERPLFESANIPGSDDGMFYGNDAEENKLNSHCAFKPVISDKLPRLGNVIDDHELLIDSRLAYNHHTDDDVNHLAPAYSLDKYAESKLSMGERITTEHDLDNGIGFDFLFKKLQNRFDTYPRSFGEGRIPVGGELMKADYMDGSCVSTTHYEQSGYETGMQRQVVGDWPFSPKCGLDNRLDNGISLGPMSSKYAALSTLKHNALGCSGMSSSDNHLFQLDGLENLQPANSKCQDSVVMRTIPSAPGLRPIHRHSLSNGIGQVASSALDIPYYGCGGDLRTLSNGKSFEGVSGTFGPVSPVENKNFHPSNHDFPHPYTKVSQCSELRSSASAVDMSLLLPQSTSGSVSLMEDLWKKSILVSDNSSVLPQGIDEHNRWQENDERCAGNDLLPSSPNLTGLSMYHQEKYLTNEELEWYKTYKAEVSMTDGQRCLYPGGRHSVSEKQRKSVFSRLTSGPSVSLQGGNEQDNALYLNASVDELMDLLNASHPRKKNRRKLKSVVEKHDSDEVVKMDKQVSPEQVKSRFSSIRSEDETNDVIKENVDDMSKETREIAFKRRRDFQKVLDKNSSKSNNFKQEDGISGVNVEVEDPLVNKQQKRRKLVRPVFSNNASADTADGGNNLLSQFHPSRNRLQ